MITSNILQTATTPNRYSNMPWKKIVREHGIIEITPQDLVLREHQLVKIPLPKPSLLEHLADLFEAGNFFYLPNLLKPLGNLFRSPELGKACRAFRHFMPLELARVLRDRGTRKDIIDKGDEAFTFPMIQKRSSGIGPHIDTPVRTTQIRLIGYSENVDVVSSGELEVHNISDVNPEELHAVLRDDDRMLTLDSFTPPDQISFHMPTHVMGDGKVSHGLKNLEVKEGAKRYVNTVAVWTNPDDHGRYKFCRSLKGNKPDTEKMNELMQWFILGELHPDIDEPYSRF